MPKGFIQKHTAKELQRKVDAHKNKGGGKEGAETRKPKTSLICNICKAPMAAIKNMREHYEAKHAKVTFNPAEYGGED
jgi:ribosomal protein L34E